MILDWSMNIFLESFKYFRDNIWIPWLIMTFFNKKHLFLTFVLSKDSVHLSKRD